MKNIPLVLRGNLFRDNHLIVRNFNSKFYKIVFKSNYDNYDANMLSSLKKIGSNIREIKFTDCIFISIEFFMNILRTFPEAKKVTFEGCFIPFTKYDEDFLDFPNLTDLVLKECYCEVNYDYN